MRVRVRARVNARVKFKIAQNRPKFFFAYVSCHYKHFIKNRANAHFCAFSFVTAERKIISSPIFFDRIFLIFFQQFDTMFISLSLLITEWASVQNNYPCARAHVLHSIYGQKHAYKKSIISLGWIRTAIFFSFLDRVWVGDMISCLIWPLSIFWHNHIDLGTQNTNLHIMTSAYLRKMIVSLQILINFLLNFDML